VEFDSGTISSVTTIWIHDTDRNSADLDLMLDTLAVGDSIKIQAEGDNDFAIFDITSNTDSGAYHTFGVTYITNDGGFANDENIMVNLTLSGPQGDTGADSTVQGDTGTAGAKGDTGDQGDTGADSTVQGDTGTAGAKGDTGTQGDTGAGDKGDTGTAGAKGDTGTQGDTGAGTQGDTGTAGAKGDTGDQGDTGTEYPWTGPWVITTVYAVNDTVENDGSGYVCTTGHTATAGDEPGVGGSWTTYWDLLVEKGDQGDTGTAGAKGDTGTAGAKGDTGTQGDTGATGDKGDTGTTGSQGDTGVGTQGDTGVSASYLYSITVENPTSSEDIDMGFTFVAITVTEIQAVVVGTTPSVTIDPYHTTSRDTITNDILSTPTAITNTTTGQNLTGFSDATIPADSWIVLETTAQSGTVTELTVTIRYTVD
jgi:hypothetical protein